MRLPRAGSFVALALLCGACGSDHRRAETSGGGPLLISDGGTDPRTPVCKAKEVAVVGTINDTNVEFRTTVAAAALSGETDKKDADPALMQFIFAGGKGQLQLHFMGLLVEDEEKRAQIDLRLKDGTALEVGNCANEGYPSKIYLSSRKGLAGTFVLEDLYKHDGDICSGSRMRGSLVGCFNNE